MMTDTLKVLIVGGGDMGGTHLRGYAALETARVTAIADPDQSRAAALAATHVHVEKTYVAYQEAIEQEKPDIVSVCVPACLHAQIAIHALEQGCFVLCEKPIALTLEEGARMVAAADASQGRLGIVFQRRYLPVWREVEKCIACLGAPLSYHAADFRPVRPKRLMHSRSGNGGPVIDCCVHDFDMTMRLFGAPLDVYATGSLYGAGKEELNSISDPAVDTATISLRFDAGHTALISCCWGLPTGFRDFARFEILGPEGMLRIGDGWIERHMAGGRVETVSGLVGDGHVAQIADYVHALRHNAPLPASPRDALWALKVSYAALESMAHAAPRDLRQECCVDVA